MAAADGALGGSAPLSVRAATWAPGTRSAAARDGMMPRPARAASSVGSGSGVVVRTTPASRYRPWWRATQESTPLPLLVPCKCTAATAPRITSVISTQACELVNPGIQSALRSLPRQSWPHAHWQLDYHDCRCGTWMDRRQHVSLRGGAAAPQQLRQPAKRRARRCDQRSRCASRHRGATRRVRVRQLCGGHLEQHACADMSDACDANWLLTKPAAPTSVHSPGLAV